MSKVIRLDLDVYEGLQKMARPFDDTPNSVIRRLLEEAGRLPGEAQEQQQLSASPASSEKRRRRREEGRTPQEAFRRPILEALMELDGKGRVADVLERVERKMKEQLTPLDYSTVKTGTVRWQVYARWERQNMVHAGLLSGPHGVWELTDEGRAYLKNGQRSRSV